jgi:hypothetical protein
MSSFRFKPALLRSEREYTLTGTHLSGPDWDVDLRDVTGVAYAETSVRYVTNRSLDLDAGGQTYRISQNIDTSAHAAREPFSGLVIATLRQLHGLHPDMQVAYGLRGGARIGMFVVGLASLAAGLGLPIAALATGISGDRLIAAALPAALLTLLGLAFGWGHRPWQVTPHVALSKLIAKLDEVSDSPEPPAG